MTTRALLAAVPPPETLARLPAPKFPSLVELLARVIENHLTLDWVLVETMMAHLEPTLPYTRSAKTLAQWATELAPQLRLRDPISILP